MIQMKSPRSQRVDPTHRQLLSALFSLLLLPVFLLSASCAKDDSNAPAAARAESIPAPAPAPTPAPQVPGPRNQAGCRTQTLPSGRPLETCIRASQTNPSSTRVVYFFHGLGGSADDLFEGTMGQVLSLLLNQLGNQAPHFVSVSYGPAGVIPVDPESDSTGKAGELISIAMPELEKELGATGAERILMGGSMGGFNVLTVAATRPRSFKAVLSLCPAVIDFDPFDPAAVEAYLQRHQPYVRRESVDLALQQQRLNFPTPDTWRASNPIEQMKNGRYDALPLFVSVGRQDEFGYIEGSRALAAAGQARNAPVSLYEVNGPHCAFDIPALVDFLRSQL